MFSSWESLSLEGMMRLHQYLQGATLILAVLTTLSAALVWRTGSRLEALVAARQAEDRRSAAAEAAMPAEPAATHLVAAQAPSQTADLRAGPDVRRLVAELRARILPMLRAASPGSVEVVATQGDAESRNFALEIEALLKEAGWTTSGVADSTFKDSPVGLFLVVHSAETAPRCAGPLQQALETAGFPAQGEAHRDRPAGSLMLVVGHRR